MSVMSLHTNHACITRKCVSIGIHYWQPVLKTLAGYYVFCDCDIILLYSSYRGAKNNILRDAGSRLPVPDANGLVVRRTDNPRILLYMYNSENKNTEVNRKNYIHWIFLSKKKE